MRSHRRPEVSPNGLTYVGDIDRALATKKRFREEFRAQGINYIEGYLSAFGAFGRLWAEFSLNLRYFAAREELAALRSHK